MTIVCINRPNRTVKRTFTEKDLERIAGYMVDQGRNPILMLVALLIPLGLGVLVCKATRAIKNLESIINLIAAILKVLAIGALIDFLIAILTTIQKGVIFLPIARVISWVIAVLLAVQALADLSVKEVLDEFEALLKFLVILDQVCEVLSIVDKK